MWNGFHIYTVDGRATQILELKEAYEVFGGNPNKTEKVSPLVSASVLYDMMIFRLIFPFMHIVTMSKNLPKPIWILCMISKTVLYFWVGLSLWGHSLLFKL